MTDDTFRLADLREKLAELDKAAAKIGIQRRRIAAAISALEALSQPEKARPLVGRPRKAGEAKSTDKQKALQIAEAGALVVREAGHPLNATVILQAINARNLAGRPIARTSLVAALDGKAHKGEMFVKTSPGTYGLIGMNGN